MGRQRNRSIRRTRLSGLKPGDRILSLFICGLVLLASGCTQPKLRVGGLAPAIGLEQLLQAPPEAAGNWDSLKGKVVVLEFWATWCGPCVAAIPHLNELADQLKDKPVQFISITDEDSKTIESFLQNRPIKTWVGLDTNGSMFRAYGVQGIPHTVVVDGEGRIAAITYPMTLNEQKLSDLLAGKNTFPKPTQHERRVMRAGVEPKGPDKRAPVYRDKYVLIRPSSREYGGMASSQSRGKLTVDSGTIKTAVFHAYNQPMTRIDCPASLDEDRYTFVVSLPKRKSDQLEPVFQRALAAAFDLDVRRERRERNVYILGAPDGKAPKLREAAGELYSMSLRPGRLTMIGVELDMLVRNLEGQLGKPVINETKLSGRFDIDLEYDPEKPDAIIEAVREQLGLELRPAKREVEVLVVESRRDD